MWPLSAACLLSVVACYNDDPGVSCRDNYDCVDVCCREPYCGRGGMCTYRCRDDRDCPGDMLCEHQVCLFACDTDRDCGPGWSCEHDHAVCEAR